MPGMLEIEQIFDECERKVLHEAMEKWDMSARAVVRRFFRLGQLVDLHMKQGHELGFLDDQGDFNPIMRSWPKLAPDDSKP